MLRAYGDNSARSLGGNAQLVVCSVLLLGKLAEESDFVFAGRFPLVIRFECRLEVRFDVHVECLGFELRVRRIVDAWYRFSRSEMM